MSKKIPLWIRRFPIRILVSIQCAYFQFLSITRTSFVFEKDGLPVSIATYGHREKWVHLTVESIMRGKARPSGIFIWRDEFAKKTPRGLKRLEKCGVNIYFLNNNHRSHKKWFGPASFGAGPFDKGVVLADDDLIYPGNWMMELKRVASVKPDNVVAWRCKTIQLELGQEGTVIAPYSTWNLGRAGQSANYLNFVTSGSGTYVPRSLLKALESRSLNMEHCTLAPTADDVWLNNIALKERKAPIGISDEYLDWPQNPMQGFSGLADENVGAGKNDETVTACYAKEDIGFLMGVEIGSR